MGKMSRQEALDYHEQGRKGKIEVIPSKPYSSQSDLSLAYSPGVAEPCKAIAEKREDVYRYTTKGNLVAVITNGTAVLGLGNIGPEASKPVMEGKGLLFKIFADIDVFDIEIDTEDVEHFVNTVKAIAPTFGGINLEDIKAPEAFEIEERLKTELDIPVMHDDQHGTAIISGAALLNALEIAQKAIDKISIVISGAGASALTCAKLYMSLGAKKENIIMLDSKGVISSSRKDLDKRKAFFATKRKVKTLEEAMQNADVFLGLSKGNILSKKMVQSMAENPIVFALANPDPEIAYEEAIATRKDIIMATGRSDHPNQVNNVLGFPYIFRGALDVRATVINEEMKLAAVRAIAALAKEPVPEEVNEAYDTRNIVFGRESFIPKPLDPRLISHVSVAVAEAAMKSGVAKNPIADLEAYREELNVRLGVDNELVRKIADKAKRNPKRVVFAEGDNYNILKAAQIARDEGIVEPILLGDKQKIEDIVTSYKLDMEGVTIIDPRSSAEQKRRQLYGQELFALRQRKGYTLHESVKLMNERNYFGAMMLRHGEADACISGITRKYRDVIKPALQVIGREEGTDLVAGMYIMLTKKGPMFFADATVNLHPDASQLADITLLVAKGVKKLGIKPRIAMLSYSNFGSSKGEEAEKVSKAVSILRENHPKLVVDGELQANFALNQELLKEKFPFSRLVNKQANTFIFPNLAAGNISYKLMQEMHLNEAIGPILLGLDKSFHVLQLGSSIREIVNMVRIAVIDAQTKK